jgi:hypothetical protein
MDEIALAFTAAAIAKRSEDKRALASVCEEAPHD